jgi:hypothetical protein
LAPELESESEPVLEHYLAPGLEPDLEPDLEPYLAPELEPELAPDLERRQGLQSVPMKGAWWDSKSGPS